MERSDVVEIGVAIASVGLFIIALAYVGTAFGTTGTTIDGEVNATLVGTMSDGDVIEGTVNGTIDGDLSDASGGSFNGTIDATFNGSTGERQINRTLDGVVNGTVTDPDGGGALEGEIDATLNGSVNSSLSGSISGTVDGNVQQSQGIAASGQFALVGAVILFVLVMAGVGLWLSRQDS